MEQLPYSTLVPGEVQARIQEFSSRGGVQLFENVDKQKKKKQGGGGERRVVALFLLAEEWFNFPGNYLPTSLLSGGGGGVGHGKSLSTQIHR